MLTASLALAGNGDYGNYGNFWNWGKHYKGHVKSVPIPATEVLFGVGFAALAWAGPKIRKRR